MKKMRKRVTIINLLLPVLVLGTAAGTGQAFGKGAAVAGPSASGVTSDQTPPQDTGILSYHPARTVLPRLRTARKPAVRWGEPPARPSLTLLQFSDLHGDAENLGRIVTFLDAYQAFIEDAIHTGDAVYCYWDNPNEFGNVPGAERILNVVGNHDCWKGHKVWAESPRPYDATQSEAYELLFTGENREDPLVAHWGVTQPAGFDNPDSPHWCACYYYKDYPEQGIRLIVLDCMHYTPVQAGWFAATLADARARGMAVVAAQHYPAQSGLDAIPGGWSDRDEVLNAVPDPGDAQMERMPDGAFSTVDGFIEAGGTFVCWLSGHTHLDFIGHVPGHRRQLQIIADKSGEGDAYMQEDRTRGSRFQDAFNLVTINPSRGILVVDRIGCDRDQYMRSKTTFCYDYLRGEVLVNE